MAQEKPNRFVEWFLLIRKQSPVLREHWNNWLTAVGEEPALIWQTPAVRYGVYGLGGLVLLLVVTRISGFVAAPAPGSARPEATTADFHVVCSDADCAHHFLIHRKFGFHRFPVRCQKCTQETGVRGRLCGSKTCGRRWVAPVESGDGVHCARCGEPFD